MESLLGALLHGFPLEDSVERLGTDGRSRWRACPRRSAGRKLIETSQGTVELPDGCGSGILGVVETDEWALADGRDRTGQSRREEWPC